MPVEHGVIESHAANHLDCAQSLCVGCRKGNVEDNATPKSSVEYVLEDLDVGKGSRLGEEFIGVSDSLGQEGDAKVAIEEDDLNVANDTNGLGKNVDNLKVEGSIAGFNDEAARH